MEFVGEELGMAQVPAGVTDVLATLSLVSLVIERIIEFIVAQGFPVTPGFLGPGSNSRRLAAFCLAVVFGTIVVARTRLGLLARLDPGAGGGFDVFFTGLLLAAGTQPIHSVLRILEQKKGARDSMGESR